METIKKSIGQGVGKGELYNALAYNADDKYGGLAIKQVRFNPESGSTAIIIGDSTTAITLATYAQRAISIYTTSASTDGSNTVLPVYIDATMSATGGVGRAFEAKLTVSGKLGGWGNAIKGYIDLTGGTGSSGLLSAICAEMKMSASTTQGTFGVLELELVCPTSWIAHSGIGTNCNSFIYAQVSGATKGEFDNHGFFFNIQGLTSATTHLLYNNTLKMAVGSTTWYLPMSSAEASYTSAYPIALTNILTVGVDGTGHDVKFYGDTVGTYMLWDQDADKLVINIVDKAASLSAITATATLDGPTSYYYGIQSNIAKSGTDNIDDCTAVTAYINQTTGAFTCTGRFAPLQVLISGSGTVGTITKTGVGAVHAAWIANRGTQTNTDSILCVHNQSAATAVSAMEFDLNGTITYALEFQGTVSDGWTSGDGAIAGSSNEYVKIPILVKGVRGGTQPVYILAAETWS